MKMKTFCYNRLFRITGDVVWGLVIAGLLAITVISHSTIGISGSKEQTNNGQKIPRETNRNEWAEAGTEASSGDATVKILRAEVGPINYATLDGIQFQSTEEFLNLKISILNRSKVKKHSYLSLGLYHTAEDLLQDEYGNSYPIYISGTVGVVGQLNYANLYPGQSVEDLIIFARPVKSARHLRLRLPGIGITGGKPLYLQFPAP